MSVIRDQRHLKCSCSFIISLTLTRRLNVCTVACHSPSPASACVHIHAKNSSSKLWADATGFFQALMEKLCSCRGNKPAVQGGLTLANCPQQFLWQPHAQLRSDITSSHWDEQKESKEKGGRGGSWFHGLQWELALHESELEWWHCPWVPVECTMTSTYVQQGLFISRSPHRWSSVTKGRTGSEIKPCPERSLLWCWHTDVYYTSQVSDCFRGNWDWFWITHSSGFHFQPVGTSLWYLQKNTVKMGMD